MKRVGQGPDLTFTPIDVFEQLDESRVWLYHIL